MHTSHLVQSRCKNCNVFLALPIKSLGNAVRSQPLQSRELAPGVVMGGAIAYAGDCASAQITPDGTLPSNIMSG